MKTPQEIKLMKGKKKIVVLTAYDYSFASIFDEAGIDILLTGDSLGMVVLGYDSTKNVSMNDMVRHTEAVSRATKNALVIADMPYGSCDSKEDALKNAQLLINAGAKAVKPEGKAEVVKHLVDNGIEVMGHIGLLPQTAETYQVEGKNAESAEKILKEAIHIEKAGAFCVVIESVPLMLAKKITSTIKIPTIGIGAGVHCDGQVLVSYDMLGLYDKFKPKFVKQYANLKKEIKKAAENYKEEVEKGEFPSDEFSYK